MKVKVNGFTYWQKEAWQREPEFVFREFERTECDTCVRVGEMSIEIEVPDDFDPRSQQVAALERRKVELQAQFTAAVTEINARINKLLAIESAIETDEDEIPF